MARSGNNSLILLFVNPKVDLFLEEGCGRCPHHRTPACKVHAWPKVLSALRRIVLECGLEEEYKWFQPCYTSGGKNVLLITALKDYAGIGFFKGSLLEDHHQMLIAPGKHSQASRTLRFTDVRAVLASEQAIKSYVFQAVEVEKAGLKVAFKQEAEPLPAELQAAFDADPAFKAAFEGLTPGRQRGYVLHFSQAKQSQTRVRRIEKWKAKILAGEGMQDGFRAKEK